MLFGGCVLKATLGDWRFVAFVSTLLLCGLPAPAHASPQTATHAPTAARSVRPVFGADSAFGADAAFEHVSAASDGVPHEWLPAAFDRDPFYTAEYDDDDGLPAPAAAVDNHHFHSASVRSAVQGGTFTCLVRVTAAPLDRGPPCSHAIARSASFSSHYPARRRRRLHARTTVASSRASAASFAVPAIGGSAALIPLVFKHADRHPVGRRLLRAPPP